MGKALMSNVGPVGSNMVPFYWADFLRDNLFPHMYFRQLGTKVTIPQGYGNTVKIPRWKTAVRQKATRYGETALSSYSGAAVAAMTEGSGTANSGLLSPESLSGFVTGWTGHFTYSDRVALVSHTDFVKGAVRELGKQLAITLDEYTRGKISGNAFTRTTSGQIGTAKTRSSEGLQGKYVALICPTMEAYNVPAWEDETFVGIINPLAKYDIFRDVSSNGFVETHRYGDPSMVYRGEIGQLFGVRFLSTTQAPKVVGTDANSASVGISPGVTGAYAWIFAPDAFYAAEQAKGGFEVIHHPPGSGGATGDPTNQIGSVGVKAYYGAIPNDADDKRLMLLSHGLGLLS